MSNELDTKIDGKDKGRHAQIKIDDLMSASTKPMKHGLIVLKCRKALIFQEYNHENRGSQFPTSHALGCKLAQATSIV